MNEPKNEVATTEKAVTLTPEKIQKIEEISSKYLYEKLNIKGELQKAMLISQGIRQMNDLVTDEVMAPLMHLMGTTMGFITDKDNKPDKYPVSVVRKVLIEGMLNGVFPYNNQLNIISSRLYIAKNGYTAKIAKVKNVTDFVWKHEILEDKTGGHHWVGFTTTWKQNGVERSLDGKIPIKNNGSTDTPDNVMGRGERKLKYRSYCAMTETTISEEEEMDADEIKSLPLETTALDDLQKENVEKGQGES